MTPAVRGWHSAWFGWRVRPLAWRAPTSFFAWRRHGNESSDVELVNWIWRASQKKRPEDSPAGKLGWRLGNVPTPGTLDFVRSAHPALKQTIEESVRRLRICPRT